MTIILIIFFLFFLEYRFKCFLFTNIVDNKIFDACESMSLYVLTY